MADGCKEWIAHAQRRRKHPTRDREGRQPNAC